MSDDVRGQTPGIPADPGGAAFGGSETGDGLAMAVRRAVARTRTQAAVAVLLAVAAVAPAVLLVAWAVGRWPIRSGPLALVGGGGVVAVAVAVVLARRWVLVVDETAVAVAAERAEGLDEGALRGVLELGRGLPVGMSAALFRHEADGLAARLAKTSPAGLTGELGRRTRRRRTRMLLATGGLTALVTVLGLALPERARAAWAPLLRPVAHLAAPRLPPLVVAPGDTAVERGAAVAVTVRAPLRDRVTVHWRAVGDVPGGRTLPVADGAARGELGPVEAPTRYWVTALDGAASDTFRIEPRAPLLVAELTVEAVYPRYTGLETDAYTGDVPPLAVPVGTVLRVRGRLTRPAGGVALDGPAGARRSAELRGPAFALDWRVDQEDEGVWSWRVAEPGDEALRGGPGRGGGGTGSAPPIDLTVTPDGPPGVQVTVPGTDTLLPPGRRQPVVADASDDYGVAAGALVFRRLGAADSVVAPFPVTGEAPRVLLRGVLDAASLGLVPGDAVEYWVTATDNGPDAQVGRSARYTLRLPSMAGLRDRAREDAARVLERARELADRSRRLESATRDVARRARSVQRERTAGGAASRPLGYDEAGRSRDVLEEHEAVVSGVDRLREQLASLERVVAEAGLGDPELRRRLEEVRELYARLASPELQASMEELSRALDALDPAAVQEALERLAEHQASLRQQVEESLEMLRRAAAEQEMNALARDAEELAARQEAFSAAVEADASRSTPESTAGAAADRESVASRQDALGEGTQGLAASLDSLRRELRSLREPDPAGAAEAAGGRARSASLAMDTAAAAVRDRQPSRAVAVGRSAAGSLRAAAERLDGARSEMAGARAREAQEAVRRATLETLELAERQESLRRSLESARRRGGLTAEQLEAARSEQAAVEQGVRQLTRTLAAAALRSALVDPAVGEALSQARQRVDGAGAGLESGGRPPVEAASRAVESLNGLALALLANEGQIRQVQEGGDGAQQAMRQLSELAQQQGSLNGQVGALTPLLDPTALARQLAELARRQAEIGRGVEQAGEALEDEDVLGQVDALADEAEALARALEAGRLDPEVRARQERLFHRLLDAGRSLEQDEYGRRRVSERAEDVAADAPAPLDVELLDTGVRYPAPSAAQLRELPPAYRALILEYFHRLNRDPPPEGAGGGGTAGGGG